MMIITIITRVIGEHKINKLIVGTNEHLTMPDVPLQKLRGVAIFVSLQECGFSRL